MTEEVITISVFNTKGFKDDATLRRMFSVYLKCACHVFCVPEMLYDGELSFVMNMLQRNYDGLQSVRCKANVDSSDRFKSVQSHVFSAFV